MSRPSDKRDIIHIRPFRVVFLNRAFCSDQVHEFLKVAKSAQYFFFLGCFFLKQEVKKGQQTQVFLKVLNLKERSSPLPLGMRCHFESSRGSSSRVPCSAG
jgi:hypothetical protein